MEIFFNQGGFVSGGVFNVTPRQAVEYCAKGAVLVDVREASLSHYKRFDVPAVIYCPYRSFSESFQTLPLTRPLIFADAAGLFSKEAVLMLLGRGITGQVANLAGGLIEWERDSMPLITDISEKLSGSCMCQLRPRGK